VEKQECKKKLRVERKGEIVEEEEGQSRLFYTNGRGLKI
jgi:hypothetical protein